LHQGKSTGGGVGARPIKEDRWNRRVVRELKGVERLYNKRKKAKDRQGGPQKPKKKESMPDMHGKAEHAIGLTL